jgi:hypothetical protein
MKTTPEEPASEMIKIDVESQEPTISVSKLRKDLLEQTNIVAETTRIISSFEEKVGNRKDPKVSEKLHRAYEVLSNAQSSSKFIAEKIIEEMALQKITLRDEKAFRSLLTTLPRFYLICALGGMNFVWDM